MCFQQGNNPCPPFVLYTVLPQRPTRLPTVFPRLKSSFMQSFLIYIHLKDNYYLPCYLPRNRDKSTYGLQLRHTIKFNVLLLCGPPYKVAYYALHCTASVSPSVPSKLVTQEWIKLHGKFKLNLRTGFLICIDVGRNLEILLDLCPTFGLYGAFRAWAVSSVRDGDLDFWPIDLEMSASYIWHVVSAIILQGRTFYCFTLSIRV